MDTWLWRLLLRRTPLNQVGASQFGPAFSQFSEQHEHILHTAASVLTYVSRNWKTPWKADVECKTTNPPAAYLQTRLMSPISVRVISRHVPWPHLHSALGGTARIRLGAA